MPPETLIPTSEVAAWLGVSERTVRRLTRRPTRPLPALQLKNSGGVLRFSPTAVREWIEIEMGARIEE